MSTSLLRSIQALEAEIAAANGPFCTRCKHINVENVTDPDDLEIRATCDRYKLRPPLSLVTGLPEFVAPGSNWCSSARKTDALCGPTGKWFEEEA